MSSLSELQPDSLLSYLIALLFPLLDAIAPIIPSESVVVALGVATAGSIDPRLFLLVMLAAAGAFVGDNLCFVLGRYFGPWVKRRSFATTRGAQHLVWAEKTLQRFGARLIFICRFIPGGRTVVTFTCGAVGYPWHRFAGVTAISGAIWATYAFVIGRVGGSTFSGKPWLGLIVALGLAAVVSLMVEGVRRLIKWRHSIAQCSIQSGTDDKRVQRDRHVLTPEDVVQAPGRSGPGVERAPPLTRSPLSARRGPGPAVWRSSSVDEAANDERQSDQHDRGARQVDGDPPHPSVSRVCPQDDADDHWQQAGQENGRGVEDPAPPWSSLGDGLRRKGCRWWPRRYRVARPL